MTWHLWQSLLWQSIFFSFRIGISSHECHHSLSNKWTLPSRPCMVHPPALDKSNVINFFIILPCSDSWMIKLWTYINWLFYFHYHKLSHDKIVVKLWKYLWHWISSLATKHAMRTKKYLRERRGLSVRIVSRTF